MLQLTVDSHIGVYRAAKEASMHLSCNHTQSCVAAAACIKDCVGMDPVLTGLCRALFPYR